VSVGLDGKNTGPKKKRKKEIPPDCRKGSRLNDEPCPVAQKKRACRLLLLKGKRKKNITRD